MNPSPSRLPAEHESVLLFQVGAAALALPLPCVEEILRPLPLEALPASAPGVLGCASVRGRRIPVVALAGRARKDEGRPTRWIHLRAGRRRLALAVDGVAGVLRLAPEALEALPPLLSELAPEEAASLRRDAPRLLALLRRGRVLQSAQLATQEGAAR